MKILKEATDLNQIKEIYIDSYTNTAYGWDGKKYRKISKKALSQLMDDAQDGDNNQDSSNDSSSASNSSSGNSSGNSSTPQIGDSADLSDEDAVRDANSASNETEDELKQRLDRINQKLNDSDTARQAQDEAEAKVGAERAANNAKASARYSNSPVKRFTDSLNRFIKNEVGDGRTQSWRKFNKTYADSGLIRKGNARTHNSKVPLINVYYDRSGSWDDSKTKVGDQAISTLYNYVRKGQVKINLYYFNTSVHSEWPYSSGSGGTLALPVMKHIQQTKPDNVIIMTDSDTSSEILSDVTVPGAVWMLFKGGRSKALMRHLKGRAQTNFYDI